MHMLLMSGLMWYLRRELRGVSGSITIQDKGGKIFCLLHTNHGVGATEETWKTVNEATFAWTILDCLTHEIIPYVLLRSVAISREVCGMHLQSSYTGAPLTCMTGE